MKKERTKFKKRSKSRKQDDSSDSDSNDRKPIEKITIRKTSPPIVTANVVNLSKSQPLVNKPSLIESEAPKARLPALEDDYSKRYRDAYLGNKLENANSQQKQVKDKIKLFEKKAHEAEEYNKKIDDKIDNILKIFNNTDKDEKNNSKSLSLNNLDKTSEFKFDNKRKESPKSRDNSNERLGSYYGLTDHSKILYKSNSNGKICEALPFGFDPSLIGNQQVITDEYKESLKTLEKVVQEQLRFMEMNPQADMFENKVILPTIKNDYLKPFRTSMISSVSQEALQTINEESKSDNDFKSYKVNIKAPDPISVCLQHDDKLKMSFKYLDENDKKENVENIFINLYSSRSESERGSHPNISAELSRSREKLKSESVENLVINLYPAYNENKLVLQKRTTEQDDKTVEKSFTITQEPNYSSAQNAEPKKPNLVPQKNLVDFLKSNYATFKATPNADLAKNMSDIRQELINTFQPDLKPPATIYRAHQNDRVDYLNSKSHPVSSKNHRSNNEPKNSDQVYDKIMDLLDKYESVPGASAPSFTPPPQRKTKSVRIIDPQETQNNRNKNNNNKNLAPESPSLNTYKLVDSLDNNTKTSYYQPQQQAASQNPVDKIEAPGERVFDKIMHLLDRYDEELMKHSNTPSYQDQANGYSTNATIINQLLDTSVLNSQINEQYRQQNVANYPPFSSSTSSSANQKEKEPSKIFNKIIDLIDVYFSPENLANLQNGHPPPSILNPNVHN